MLDQSFVMIKFIVFALLILNVFAACNSKIEKNKPNIVFLFTDDQTYTTIRALGNDEIFTPNMDKLVKNGTSFTHTYNMGAWSGAVCAASRAMMISGRSVWDANEFRQHWIKGDSIQQTWGQLMKQEGYETYMTGKWHVNAKANSVFDHVIHERPGMPKDAWEFREMEEKFDRIEKLENVDFRTILPVGYNRPKDKNDKTWLPNDRSQGGFWEGGKHWSEVLAEDAINYINTAATNESPFFMYLAFNAPHDPRQAPEEFLKLYDEEKITVPKNWLPEYPDRHLIGNGNRLRDENLAPYPRSAYAIKTHLKEYYASISHLDAQIGKILAALEKSGKKDNTYIILSSDHGLAMGKHGFMGKQNLYDHSIRPPLVIVGPDIPKQKQVNADVYLQDVMATSLELAGVEKPDYVFFNSFKDLAQGKQEKSHYHQIYGAYLRLQRMIRKDNFKLLVYPKAQKVKLFDLKNDPDEMHDISKKYPNKVEQLFKDLKHLQIEMNDALELGGLENYLKSL